MRLLTAFKQSMHMEKLQLGLEASQKKSQHENPFALQTIRQKFGVGKRAITDVMKNWKNYINRQSIEIDFQFHLISTRGLFCVPALKDEQKQKEARSSTYIRLWKHDEIKNLLQFVQPLLGDNLGFMKHVFEFEVVYRKQCEAKTKKGNRSKLVTTGEGSNKYCQVHITKDDTVHKYKILSCSTLK